MSQNGRGPTPEHFKAAAWKAIRPVVGGEIPMGRVVFEYPNADGTISRIKIIVERVPDGEDPDATDQVIEDLQSAKTSRTVLGWDDGPQPASGARKESP